MYYCNIYCSYQIFQYFPSHFSIGIYRQKQCNVEVTNVEIKIFVLKKKRQEFVQPPGLLCSSIAQSLALKNPIYLIFTSYFNFKRYLFFPPHILIAPSKLILAVKNLVMG